MCCCPSFFLFHRRALRFESIRRKVHQTQWIVPKACRAKHFGSWTQLCRSLSKCPNQVCEVKVHPIKNKLSLPNFFQVRRTPRTRFLKQKFIQVRTGLRENLSRNWTSHPAGKSSKKALAMNLLNPPCENKNWFCYLPHISSNHRQNFQDFLHYLMCAALRCYTLHLLYSSSYKYLQPLTCTHSILVITLTIATNLWFFTTSRMKTNSDSKLLAQTSRIPHASIDCCSSVATGILPPLSSTSNTTQYTCTHCHTYTNHKTYYQLKFSLNQPLIQMLKRQLKIFLPWFYPS